MKPDGKGCILIVDDDDRNRRLMDAVLRPLGHILHFAEDGQKALDQIHTVRPDLILLDIMMPVMDGYEVLEKIKSDGGTKSIPVIMITALSDTPERVRAFDLGADDFISKPPERTELTARVRSLLRIKAYQDRMAEYQRDLEHEVARITEQLRRAYQDLRNASLDTVYRLTQASEYKDEDTGIHIRRVSELSSSIARKMGLPPRLQDSLLYAAPMHDVGKIGIPDDILLKPGPLDEEEWEIMKTHSSIGARILSGSGSAVLKMGEEIALTHHERWDGSGYPQGLAEERIPITGRIVAVADVFDALTSPRPYRGPVPDEEAKSHVTGGAGTQFDPAVVEAFMALGEEIAAIRQRAEESMEGEVDASGIFPCPSGHDEGKRYG